MVKDFTDKILVKSGTKGGNTSLFVNSKEAFFSQKNQMNNSPLRQMAATCTSGFLKGGETSAIMLDYHTLKKTRDAASRGKLNARSSSISQVRLDREFTQSPHSRKHSIDAADKAE